MPHCEPAPAGTSSKAPPNTTSCMPSEQRPGDTSSSDPAQQNGSSNDSSAPTSTSVVFPQLTERERAVLRLVANGHNNTVIAHSLDLAPKTIANHVSNILTKLQIADRAQAIVAARRAGLADDEHRP